MGRRRSRPWVSTLEEAWRMVREMYGDEIAQQGVLETLTRQNKNIGEIPYLIEKCRWMKVIHYTDGADIRQVHKDKDGKHTRVAAKSLKEWQPSPVYDTPEAIALAREEALRLHETGAMLLLEATSFKPYTQTCRWGHEGFIRYRRNRRGVIERRCTMCAKRAVVRALARRHSRKQEVMPTV